MPKPSSAASWLTTVGGKLAMVAGEHETIAAQQRNPAARFGALAGLVDHHEIKTPRAQQLAVDAGGRGADHRGRIEDALRGLQFHFPRVGQERAGIVAKLFPFAGLRRGPPLPAGLAKEAHRLLDQLAGQPHVAMTLHEEIERMLAQLRQHAGRMPQPHDPLAETEQAFEDVVDGQVARGAGQHLAAAADRLANDFHDGRRLAGAGRAVDQADIAGRQGELHGVELHLIERAVQRPDGPVDAKLRLPLAEQHVAQDRRAVAAEHAGLLQGGPLPLRGHFVERDVDPPGVVFAQFVRQAVEGHGDRDFIAFADHAAVGEFGAVLMR